MDYCSLATELEELNNICNLDGMLRLVKNFKNKLMKCNSDVDSLQVFAKLLICDGRN